MQVQAYLSLGGRCEEALELYKKAIGAETTMVMRWKDRSDPGMKDPPEDEEKIMHAAFKVGETTLMADDGMGPEKTEVKGVMLSVNVPHDADAKSVFSALGEGGQIDTALTKTFWTSSFGVLHDKFGVPCMVNVEA